TGRAEQLARKLAAAEARRAEAAAVESAALAKLHESDAEMSAVAEQLGRLGTAARTAAEEVEKLAAAEAEARQALEQDRPALAEMEERVGAAEEAGDDDAEPPTEERDRLLHVARQARQAETEARLALRTGEERARALTGRAESLERTARSEREARERAATAARRRARQAEVAAAVARGATILLDHVERSLERAAAERAEAEQIRAEREAALSEERAKVRQLSDELDEITSTVHKDELARAEHRMRVEALETKAMEEHGIEGSQLIDEYGPHLPVPVPPDADGQPREPVPYVRDEQLKRMKTAERELSKLGKVNPLALQEYAALEERHSFLSEQLADLKNSRRDLLDIVKEVDDRVQQVFAEAFEDTAREFADVFGRLFPGGE